MNRIVCVGESLVDFIAQAEVPDIGSSEVFQRAAGGAVCNVSAGIARLGGHAVFCGTISKDSFGKFLLSTLAHENVNVDGVRLVGAATTLAFVARGPQGARDFIFIRNPGADSLLEPGDLDSDMLEHAKALHFGGVLLSSEPARSACFAAAAVARKAGAMISFDPNVRPSLFSSVEEMRRVTLEACESSSLVKNSDEDMAALGFRSDDPSQLLRGETRAVVITRGSKGCRWATADGAGEADAPLVECIDTTGAGDAFMAALLWRLVFVHHAKLEVESLRDAARYASVAGALACAKEGAIPSLPHAAELEAAVHGKLH